MAAAPAVETALHMPPEDGISSVKFSKSSNLLLVSSWDKSVRLYDAGNNIIKSHYQHDVPVLDCCFSDDERSFSGGLDNAVRMHNFSTGNSFVLGSHDEAVRCLEHSEALGLVLSGSWDKTVKVWDPRAESPLTSTVALPDKCFTLAMTRQRLVVGCAGQSVLVYDLRNLSEPEMKRGTTMKHQTRCIRCLPDGSGYAIASTGGRVAVQYFAEGSGRDFAFKCHRRKEAGVDVVYPVNALAFHPTLGTFATGGADGTVSVWDAAQKKRVTQFHSYPTSISALDFNHDGSLLAIAASYTWEQGEKEHPSDQIIVRRVADTDVRLQSKPAE